MDETPALPQPRPEPPAAPYLVLLPQLTGRQLLDLADDIGRIAAPGMTVEQLRDRLERDALERWAQERGNRVQRAPDTASEA